MARTHVVLEGHNANGPCVMELYLTEDGVSKFDREPVPFTVERVFVDMHPDKFRPKYPNAELVKLLEPTDG